MHNPVYQTVHELITEIESTQNEAIEAAALLMVQTIENGGLIQAYGAGHSFAGALDLCHRAGGLIPTKALREPSGGIYESVEGVGTSFIHSADVREVDVVVIFSSSGRNPLPIEIALECKAKGAKIILITALESSKNLKSKHSSGLSLYQLADVVIDNKVVGGDATITLPISGNKICGMSIIAASLIIQALTYRTAELIEESGKIAPIYKSQNIDGGRAFNESLELPYKDRLSRT